MSQEQLDALIKQGQEWLKRGDRAAARKVFIEAIKIRPGDSGLWVALSKAANDAHEERRCLEEALKRDPANPVIQAMLAVRDLSSQQHGPPASATPSQATALQQQAVPAATAAVAPSLVPQQSALSPALPFSAQAVPQQLAPTVRAYPLNSIDPWADDPAGLERCPYCAQPDPGRKRCSLCRRKLTFRVFKPRGTSLYILCTVLLGRAAWATIVLLFVYAVASFTARQSGQPLFGESDQVLVIVLWVAAAFAIGYPLVMAIAIFLRQTWAWLIGIVTATIDFAVSVLGLLVALQNDLPFIPSIISILLTGGMLFLYI